jgi:hypothetical protein
LSVNIAKHEKTPFLNPKIARCCRVNPETSSGIV